MNTWLRTKLTLLLDALPYLGFSIYLAWPFALFYSPLLEGSGYIPYNSTYLLCASTLAFSATLMVLALVRAHKGSRRPSRASLFGFACMLIFGIFIAALSKYAGGLSLLVTMISGALTGIGSSYVTVHYGVLFSQHEDGRIAIMLPLCFGLSGSVFFLVTLLPSWMELMALLVLPLLPLRCLANSLHQPRQPRGVRQQSFRVITTPLMKFLVSIVAFGLVFGYQRGSMSEGILVGAGVGIEVGNAIYFTALSLFAFAFAYVCWKRKKAFDVERLYKAAAIAMAAGLISFSYIPEFGRLAAGILIAAAYILFDTSVWLALSGYARRSRRNRIAIFSIGFAASHMGMFLGELFGFSVVFAQGQMSGIIGIVTALVELVLLIAAMTTFTNIDIKLLHSETPEGGAAEKAHGIIPSKELAQTFGLSEREEEVLSLLLSGRNAAYIEKTLFLSKSTVKTHRRHIYDKIGVHSAQELLDLAEEYRT